MASKAVVPVLVALVAIFSSLFFFLKDPIALRLEVFGFLRQPDSIEKIHGTELQQIPGTLYSEDIHYHAPSGLIFGAAEPHPDSRKNWFPGLGKYGRPDLVGQGSMFVIDTQASEIKAKKLKLKNFDDHAFVTHGIDIFSPATAKDTVYIFAVNHLPNPSHSSNLTHSSSNVPAAASQIEVFSYTLGSDEATHLRSVEHPLIRTPNDIYIVNEHEFYVTNDHHYRDGLMRGLEDMGWDLAAWSDIVRIRLSSLTTTDGAADLEATIVRDRTHNPNGFGHGKDEDEVLLGRAAAGVMETMRLKPDGTFDVLESFQYPMTIDNPSYFQDPYAAETGRDASGYVNAGLATIVNFPDGYQIPVAVWYVNAQSKEKRLIFQDDGSTITTASSAVIVAIDPKANGGRKEAWLFVTGFMSKAVVRTKIAL